MLSVDDPRIEPLRKQADVARVNWEFTCGCAGLCSPVLDAYHRLPVDEQRFCELIVFLEDGWLSSLELVWYSKPIAEFPPPAEFQPPYFHC